MAKKKVKKAPQLFAELCVALWDWTETHVGILLLVATFLGGLGLGAFLAVDKMQIEGKCATFIRIDPLGNQL